MIAILIALGIDEIEANRELDMHCPDTVRGMIQDSCRNLQRLLNEKRQKKKLAANGRNKRENNDTPNDVHSNGIDGINDDQFLNFTVQFVDNECEY